MHKRLLGMLLALFLLCLAPSLTAACGGEESSTSESDASTTTSVASDSEEVFKIAYNEGFTGPMAYDAALADQGIQTALNQLGDQVLGKPIEYSRQTTAWILSQAVDKARQLVESEGIHMHMGPIFAPAAAAVTDYLSQSGWDTRRSGSWVGRVKT